MLMNQSRYAEALPIIKRSYRLIRPNAPKYAKVLCLANLAWAFYKLNQLDSAIFYSKQALILEPKRLDFWIDLAHQYLLKKDTISSFENLNNFLLHGGDPKLVFNDTALTNSLGKYPQMKILKDTYLELEN